MKARRRLIDLTMAMAYEVSRALENNDQASFTPELVEELKEELARTWGRDPEIEPMTQDELEAAYAFVFRVEATS